MGRDRWFAVAVIGAALTCVSYLAPLAVVALGVGAVGLGGRVEDIGAILFLALVALAALAVDRHRNV